MASRRKKVAKAVPFSSADLQNITNAYPYLQRLMEDSKLRDNIGTAIDSAKSAFDRLTSSKQPQKTLVEDKKLHKDAQRAYESARDAIASLSESPRKHKAKKKGRHLGRWLFLLMAGTGGALAASEGLRSKVLDALFGAEEEFQYTPPTPSPTATPPPQTPVSAA